MRRLLPLIFMLAGCSQGDPCVSQDDCFRGEVCLEGFCSAPVAGADAGSDTGADAATVGDTGGSPNNENNENNVAVDMTTPDDVGGVDQGSSGACIVDPFDECTDDENSSNNSFPGEAFAPMTRGCQSSGFVPLDMVRSGRQCALDPEDQYYLTIVECDEDEAGMIIELTLDIKDDCDEDLIFFDVESIGTSCADPNPDADVQIQCETLATGERRISTLWPGQSGAVVGSIRWSIQTPDRMDVQFDYDLHVVVREL